MALIDLSLSFLSPRLDTVSYASLTFLSLFQGNLWGGGPKREGGQFPHPEVAVGEDREVKPLASSQSLEIFYLLHRGRSSSQ